MRIKIVKKLSDKGYPTDNKHYPSAHEEASKVEKLKFSKGYMRLKKIERHFPKDELLAKNTKKGKIEIERKFSKYKKELSFHERTEHKNLTRMNKK
jgi:hypothetical protein